MSIQESEKKLRPHISSLLALWRGGGKGGPLTPRELQRAGSALLTLQRGLTGERTLLGSGYMNDSILLGAYLLYYWPVSYLQASLALSSVHDLFRPFSSLRVLDLGCGPASASVALMDLAGERELSFTLYDSSSKALKIAEKLLTGNRHHIEAKAGDLENEEIVGEFDCIILSHLLNELWKDKEDCLQRRVEFLKKLGTHLSEHGFFLLLEPALLSTSRSLIAVRDALCHAGYRVEAPCIGSFDCPAMKAGEAHTCHAEIGWKPIEPMASLARVAGLDRESVKMTYFIMKKDQTERDSSSEVLVVSEGMLNKAGRLRFLLCDGRERFPLSAPKGDLHAKEEQFPYLRRYDRIEIQEPERRGDGKERSYGIGEKTHIKVISRLAR